jgi:hypothetical protein
MRSFGLVLHYCRKAKVENLHELQAQPPKKGKDMTYRLMAVLYIFFMLIVSMTAGAAATKHEQLIRGMLEASGLRKTIEVLMTQFPEQTTSQFQLTGISPDIGKHVAKALKSSFHATRAQEQAVDYFLRHSDVDTIEAISRWLRSAEARAITKEEIQALSLTEQAGVKRCLEGLQKKPLSEQHISFIKGIIELMEEPTFTLYENLIKGLIEPINLVIAKEKRVSDIELKKHLTDLKPALRGVLRENAALTALCTYNNITTNDLEKYLNFLRSEYGRKYLQISHEAIGYIINLSLYDAITKVSPMIKKN